MVLVGLIEPFDISDSEAMRREFAEETGHFTSRDEWIPIATMTGSDWEVEVFTYDHLLDNMSGWDGQQTDTTETLRVVRVKDIFTDVRVISNLPWLIGMCLDPDIHSGHYSAKNKEKHDTRPKVE
jgi:8-oxo-dGTP pyrophosphatase MutT (NUDIX family)